MSILFNSLRGALYGPNNLPAVFGCPWAYETQDSSHYSIKGAGGVKKIGFDKKYFTLILFNKTAFSWGYRRGSG
jgi:hypothetical protein